MNNIIKKTVFSAVFILFGIIFLGSFQSAIMKKDGAEPGYTGSPGDSLKNCTACHGGTAVNADGWLTSDIPSEGYFSGQTYTITATNKEADATRFGFEVSPQDSLGNLLGIMKITDSLRTKFCVGSEKYMTYTQFGVEGQDSLSWSFEWIAPPVNTGEVVFYGGFNSNFNGHKGDDQTYLSTLKVKENPANSILSMSNIIPGFTIYPNPFANSITIEISNFQIPNSNFQFVLYDVLGQQVHLQTLNSKLQTSNFNLPIGIYFYQIISGKKAMARGKIIKQ